MKSFRQIFRWCRCRLALLLTFLLLASCPSSLALASGGFNYVGPQLPNRTLGYSTQSGLQIKVDSTWVGNRGYWPIQVQVSSPKASTADRQITIRFSAGHRSSQPRAITIEQDFELVQGDTTASIQLLVPQLTDWNVCDLEVWVDGILDKQLSLLSVPFNRTNNNASTALVMSQRSGEIKLGSAFQERLSDGRIDVAPGNWKLSEKWLDYSSIDVVVTTPEELQEWKTESSIRCEELLRWVRAGGNLWVVGAGSELTKLPEIERALGISGGQQSSSARSSDDPAPGWYYLPLQGRATTGVEALLELKSPGSYEVSSRRRPRRGDRGDPDLAVDSRRWFVTRAFGMGTVTVFRTPHDQTSEMAIEAVDRSLLANRIAWGRRHGNDPGQGNYEFNNFLIPEVGLAPDP